MDVWISGLLNSPGCSCCCSPLVQFNLLHSKFHLCSVPTRALLLSAYIKFINLFPEVKTTIQGVLRSDSQLRNADVELQQRAVEYLRLSCIASTDILVSHIWAGGIWTGGFTITLLHRPRCWKRCLPSQRESLLSWPS